MPSPCECGPDSEFQSLFQWKVFCNLVTIATQSGVNRFNPCFSGRYSAIRFHDALYHLARAGFNPCFSGRYSAIFTNVTARRKTERFNPCFSGRYSAITWYTCGHSARDLFQSLFQWKVFCNPKRTSRETGKDRKVSILVLVEGILQFIKEKLVNFSQPSFNPCFSGRYSAIPLYFYITTSSNSFNPCFSGRYSAIACRHAKRKKSAVSILVLVEGILQF